MARRTSAPEDFVRGYGLNWKSGVLSEHVLAFTQVGGVVRPASSGSGLEWAVLPDGTAYPVLCPELIEVPTEDGPITGRCGFDATVDGACPAHAEERAAWLASSEAERASWERYADR